MSSFHVEMNEPSLLGFENHAHFPESNNMCAGVTDLAICCKNSVATSNTWAAESVSAEQNLSSWHEIRIKSFSKDICYCWSKEIIRSLTTVRGQKCASLVIFYFNWHIF